MKYFVAISMILFCSCNPAKRLAKQQTQYQQLVDEYIKNHPPRIDTATKFLPGVDSSIFYKNISDSLKKVTAAKSAKNEKLYRDTCTTAKDNFDEGFNLGYKVGFAGAKQEPIHDTIEKRIYPFDQIESLKKENELLTAQLAAAKLKDASEFNWLWPFIISCIVIVLLTALLIKKFIK